jgi:hypothetical protein
MWVTYALAKALSLFLGCLDAEEPSKFYTDTFVTVEIGPSTEDAEIMVKATWHFRGSTQLGGCLLDAAAETNP